MKVFFPCRYYFCKESLIRYKAEKKYIGLGNLVPQKLNDLGFRPTVIITNAYMVGHH